MSLSDRYSQLRSQVEELRQHLLPPDFNPTGTYDEQPRTQFLAVAFRLLAHAEIEAYLEDRAFELFAAGWSAWHRGRFPSGVMIALLCQEAKRGSPLQSPARLAGRERDEYPIQLAQQKWRETHKSNHGVREDDLRRLFLPLGLDLEQVVPNLVADLNSFGRARGEVAHHSATQLTKEVDPKEELDRVKNLLLGLEDLDETISETIATIPSAGTSTQESMLDPTPPR